MRLPSRQTLPFFLQRQEKLVGKVFRVNLAGRVMVIIGSDVKARRQVEMKPESVCSARQAVSDIGFEYTLGTENVYEGSDWHRIVVKQEVYGKQNEFLREMIQQSQTALDEETKSTSSSVRKDAADSGMVHVKDLFDFSRRVTLRIMINLLLSPLLLEADGDDLLNQFMIYQDNVEEATASNAVLPRFLGLPLFLWPSQRERLHLVARLSPLIAAAFETKNAETLGPWLQCMKEEQMDAKKAAEFSIGLLYASHKSPSIGASQSYCMLQSRTTAMERAEQEAKELIAAFKTGNDGSISVIDILDRAVTLKACVLETMRHAAHTIGGIRTAKKDFVLQGQSNQTYTIKKGDVLAITHNIPNLDSESWKSANDFDLEQWKNDDYNQLLDRLATFSGGMHKCPGRNFAIWYMQSLLALWLSREMKFTGDEMPPICFERATVAQRKSSVPVQIRQQSTA
jgi:cytochrome P450